MPILEVAIKSSVALGHASSGDSGRHSRDLRHLVEHRTLSLLGISLTRDHGIERLHKAALVLELLDNNVLNDVVVLRLLRGILAVLGVHDKTQLCKVLNDILRVQSAVNAHCMILHKLRIFSGISGMRSLLELGQLDELKQDGVEDSVQLPGLRQPRPATQTERRVRALQKVDHNVQDVVLAVAELLSERSVHRLACLVCRVLPELGKLLDC